MTHPGARLDNAHPLPREPPTQRNHMQHINILIDTISIGPGPLIVTLTITAGILALLLSTHIEGNEPS